MNFAIKCLLHLACEVLKTVGNAYLHLVIAPSGAVQRSKNPRIWPKGSVTLTTWQPISAKVLRQVAVAWPV
jgi:hypothetical protein